MFFYIQKLFEMNEAWKPVTDKYGIILILLYLSWKSLFDCFKIKSRCDIIKISQTGFNFIITKNFFYLMSKVTDSGSEYFCKTAGGNIRFFLNYFILDFFLF